MMDSLKALNSLRRQPEALALIRELDLVLPEEYEACKKAVIRLRGELEAQKVSAEIESSFLHQRRFNSSPLYREFFREELAALFPNLRPYSPPFCRYVGMLRYAAGEEGIVRPVIFRQVDLFNTVYEVLSPSDIS